MNKNKTTDAELVVATVISAVSIGIYLYDVVSRKRELKKQTALLKEIKDHVSPKKCKKPEQRKHRQPIFHHPV